MPSTIFCKSCRFIGVQHALFELWMHVPALYLTVSSLPGKQEHNQTISSGFLTVCEYVGSLTLSTVI
jgi:hypothetical protein